MVKFRVMADRFSEENAQQRIYRAFETLVAGEDGDIDLVQAALLIASLEYPDLDMAHYLAQLDGLARRVRVVLTLPDPTLQPQLPPETDPLDVIDAINQVLFDEEEFRGNREDYYNPHNSFFNKVLEERTGIPITLALLYMEVGRRVGLQIDGVALPYQFVVRCQLPENTLFIDVFEGGRLLNEQECREHIQRMARGRMKINPHWFRPVTRKLLLARMLNNLKHIYLDTEDYERVLKICDLIVLLIPHMAGEWRDRGIIHLQLKHYARALHDLTAYVERVPKADDLDEIEDHIKMIRQIMAMMN